MIIRDRRHFLRLVGAGALGMLMPGCAEDSAPGPGRRVVVVGGGFGGTVAAKFMRLLDPSIEVTLIERNRQHVACPFSNHVLAGLRRIEDLAIGYDGLSAHHGIRMVYDEVMAIDPAAREVTTREAGPVGYDRLILAPGIDFRFEEIEGYDPASTPQEMPHAWKAGDQTVLLRRQIEAMRDGGTVLISVPLTPYRCPPGPYERACLVAAYLKRTKPKSKVVLLDANPEPVSLPGHFRKAWDSFYGGMIDYHPGTIITQVDGKAKTLFADGIVPYIGDVVNFIPPQRAGALAVLAGLGEGGNWCPVHPGTFESTVHKGIHVIGDAAMAGAMPKSGYSANAQAKACAMNVVALMNKGPTVAFSGINVCYSAIGEGDAVSVAAVYKAAGGAIVSVPDAGGASPLDFSAAKLEHLYAESWLRNILAEMST